MFYDDFLLEPTRESFRDLIKNNFGEFDDFDFKEEWIDNVKLAKLIISMGNSGGGVIVFGIKEEADGTFTPVGLSEFKDEADINNGTSKYISSNIDYQTYNFDYKRSEYAEMEGKKFQTIIVNYTPERLPFFPLSETTGLEEDAIYVRRGTKSVKANREDIQSLIDEMISAIYKDGSEISLSEHLMHMRTLYGELPKKINVLIKKGQPSKLHTTISNIGKSMPSVFGTPDEYEEQDNPFYPEEQYEAFIIRMIRQKKIKIEKVLDLK